MKTSEKTKVNEIVYYNIPIDQIDKLGDYDEIIFTKTVYKINFTIFQKLLINFFGKLCVLEMDFNLLYCVHNLNDDKSNLLLEKSESGSGGANSIILNKDNFKYVNTELKIDKIKLESHVHIPEKRMLVVFQKVKDNEYITYIIKDKSEDNNDIFICDSFKHSYNDIKYDNNNNKIFLLSKGQIICYNADNFYNKNINSEEEFVYNFTGKELKLSLDFISKKRMLVFTKEKILIFEYDKNFKEIKLIADLTEKNVIINEFNIDIKKVITLVCQQDKIAIIYADQIKYLGADA